MLHREDSNRLIYKFNGGNGAVLCSNCYKIMYEGSNIPEDMMNAVKNGQQKEFGPVFCCPFFTAFIISSGILEPSYIIL